MSHKNSRRTEDLKAKVVSSPDTMKGTRSYLVPCDFRVFIFMVCSASATEYVRTAGYNCGTGTAQTIYPGDSITCCANQRVKGYDFTLTTTRTFAYSSKVYTSASSNTYLTGSDCDVHSSGQTCSGEACHAQGSYLNDCKADQCCWASYADYWCMKVSCEEPTGLLGIGRGDDCEFDEWSLSFDSTSAPVSSPPPLSSPPPRARSPPPSRQTLQLSTYRIASESCVISSFGNCETSEWLAGRLEVKINDEFSSWGTVCDDSFTDNAADLACKKMGYAYGTMLSNGLTVDGSLSQSIMLDDVSCPSYATSIDACSYSTSHNCAHDEDVGVKCFKSSPKFRISEDSCTSGACDSSSVSEGRLEVSFSDGSVWGTVCDDGFNDNVADTICREMGFAHGTMLHETNFHPGDFSQTILMDNIVCPNGAASFSGCTSEGAHDCRHAEDVGLTCTISEPATSPSPAFSPTTSQSGCPSNSDECETVCDTSGFTNG